MVDQLDLCGDRDLVLRGAPLRIEGDRKNSEAVDRAAKNGIGVIGLADQFEPSAGDHLVSDRLRDELFEANARRAIDERRDFDSVNLRVERIAAADERVAARREQRQWREERFLHIAEVSTR